MGPKVIARAYSMFPSTTRRQFRRQRWGKRVYALHPRLRMLFSIDPRTGTVTNEQRIEHFPRDAHLLAGEGRLFCASRENLSLIDPTTRDLRPLLSGEEWYDMFDENYELAHFGAMGASVGALSVIGDNISLSIFDSVTADPPYHLDVDDLSMNARRIVDVRWSSSTVAILLENREIQMDEMLLINFSHGLDVMPVVVHFPFAHNFTGITLIGDRVWFFYGLEPGEYSLGCVGIDSIIHVVKEHLPLPRLQKHGLTFAGSIFVECADISGFYLLLDSVDNPVVAHEVCITFAPVKLATM